jgi:hypothetical protein
MQIGGGFDAAPHDGLGGCRGRLGVAEGRGKGGAEVSTHTDLVSLAHLSSGAISSGLPPLEDGRPA